MSHDPELRRSKIAVRLKWLQESGVALPADLAEMAQAWEEPREREAAADVRPTLGDRVSSSNDAVEVAALLSEGVDGRPDAWLVYSAGDHVAAWLGKHPGQAIALFRALAEKGERGEALASRVVAWLSDRADHSEVLSCLSMLAGSSKTEFNEYLISSVARALRVIAESVSEVDAGDEFWPSWSFVVDTAANSSKPVQAHENPLTDSLNAPGGCLAEALILRVQHETSNGTPEEHLKERLNALAAGDRDFHFLARTMLASRLPWLHAIDREWAADVLIARMGWNGSEPTSEARGLWQGYLWAPSLNPKLLEDLKPAFLQALTFDLGLRGDDNLFRLFADLLLKAPDKLSASQKHSAFRDMPVDGLVACARYWRQVLQGASEGAARIWKEKVEPTIGENWPVVRTKVTPGTVEALALLAIQTREVFPEAFAALSRKSLLLPLARSGFILHGLADPRSDLDTSDHYDYVGNHPIATLKLIDTSIDFDALPFEKEHLRAILDRARRANDSVELTDEYRRLYQRSLS
jgi:hypothetical protein